MFHTFSRKTPTGTPRESLLFTKFYFNNNNITVYNVMIIDISQLKASWLLMFRKIYSLWLMGTEEKGLK